MTAVECRPTPALVLVDAIDEWNTLGAALRICGPAPCESGDVLPAEAWWSTDADEVTLAIAACVLCPAVAPCRRYAEAAGEREGVWGGLTAAERRPK